jgi:hypothetical protein
VIHRGRVNFKAWAEWDPPGTPTPIRCSEKKSWFTRQSYKRTGPWDDGTATSATVRTLTDVDKNWIVNTWVPGVMTILDGKGQGQVRRVTSNAANTL